MPCCSAATATAAEQRDEPPSSRPPAPARRSSLAFTRARGAVVPRNPLEFRVKIRSRTKGMIPIPHRRIRPNPKNWRLHPIEQRNVLRGVFADVGIVDAVLVRPVDDEAVVSLQAVARGDAVAFQAWFDSYTGDYILVDGHLRVEELQIHDGLIDAIVLDIDAREEAEVLATFDPISTLAETDLEKLEALAREVQSESPDVRKLIEEVAAAERRDRDSANDALGEAEAEARGTSGISGGAPAISDEKKGAIATSVDEDHGQASFPDAASPTFGDVLEGRARWSVINEDSLLFLQSCPSEVFDAVISDPPYSSGGQFRGDRARPTTEKYVQTGTKIERPNFVGDNRDGRSFIAWCVLWLIECVRCLKPGAPVCLFTDWRQLPSVTDAMQAAGFVWRGIVPWDKGEGTRPVMGRFRAQAEYIVWGSNGPMPLDREVGVLPGAYTIPVRQDDKFHETGKPTELMRKVNAITVPNGLIFDPFFGSASTGAAALLDGYRVAGCEKTEAYAAIARGRLHFVEQQVHGVEVAA